MIMQSYIACTKKKDNSNNISKLKIFVKDFNLRAKNKGQN